MRNLPKTTLILLALAATPTAWAMTAGEFAPPQPPAGLSQHPAPAAAPAAHTQKPRPALVQDGSSFVFATVKTASNSADNAGQQVTNAAKQPASLARSARMFSRTQTQGDALGLGGVQSQRASRKPLARGKALVPKHDRVRRALLRRQPAKVQIVHIALARTHTGSSFARGRGDVLSRRTSRKPLARSARMFSRTQTQGDALGLGGVQSQRASRKPIAAERQLSFRLRRKPPLPAGARLVSTRDYNLFTFPSPLRKAILPPDAPVAGKPIYLDGGHVLMLRFYPDGRQPVQLVAEMQSGVVVTMSLVPDSHKSGARITIAGPVPATASLHEYSTNPNARYVRELSKLMSGHLACPKRLHAWDSVRHDGRRVPVCWAYPLPGFTNKPLPPERIYNRLIARPVVSTGDGETVITAYILHARDHKRSVVDPGQFSWVGVHAALLTGDLVDRYHSPVLYIVTSTNH